MKKILKLVPFIFTCLAVTQVNAAEHVYNIKHTDTAPVIDGNGSDAVWEQADALTDFTFPWRADPAPKTEFKALWDAEAVYFRYQVADSALAIGSDPARGALDSDRVEVFLAKDAQLSTYYTMEIDPKAQIYSAEATYDMALKKRTSLDDSFSWGSLEYAASYDQQGYTVEIKLPRAKIAELDLWQDKDQSQLLCALMRAEFTPLEDGKIDMGWMTWLDPQTAKPNFHNPGTFGQCVLTK